ARRAFYPDERTRRREPSRDPAREPSRDRRRRAKAADDAKRVGQPPLAAAGLVSRRVTLFPSPAGGGGLGWGANGHCCLHAAQYFHPHPGPPPQAGEGAQLSRPTLL